MCVRNDVVALYVDPRGPYPGLVADWYDAARDARRYDGPLPVVAHPPCGPWGRLRHLSRKDSPRLAIHAVEQVQRWGGVLEHPADSQLWAYCDLPRVRAPADEHGGFTVEVCQVEWGHVARKRTWLYVVGVPREALTPPPMPGRSPTHWVSGRRTPFPGTCRSSRPGVMPPGIKVCSAQQRRRTPPAFAEWLLALAAQARRVTHAESA